MANPPDQPKLVFDWSELGPQGFTRPDRVTINDETLRDGLQSPSVTDPSVETKIKIVHLMDKLGIEHASMGLPCASPRQMEAVVRLCQEIGKSRLDIRPNCGGRTLVADIEAIVEVAQTAGVPVEACMFIGSSPIRQYAEAWDLDQILDHTRTAVEFAVNEGLQVTYITEDTTRSSPDHLRALFMAAVDAGASRVCLCDTAGAAIPQGVMNLVGWVRQLLDETRPEVEIDWHGHRDRGLGLANTLAAMQAGATRLHGTALGIGERVGNTSTEELLVNLELLGIGHRDLSQLPIYVETVATALGVTIPPGHPIVGRDAFRTATGVHAAAVVKAQQKGDSWLADRVYSGVPASWLGRHQEIEVGPLSGGSNVVHFLRTRGLREDPQVVEAVLLAAKKSNRVLTEQEVLVIVEQTEAGQ
ncbi:MAG: LeuA family protein [Planctomycetota bacterium]|jgi:2-isopropylmalate synthase